MGGKKFGILLVLAAAAGMIFLFYGFWGRLPAGAAVGGTDISGLTPAEAVQKLRRGLTEEMKDKSLSVVVDGKKYLFRYPELNVRADLVRAVAAAGRGTDVPLPKRYYLTDGENALRRIADDFYKRSENASLHFDASANEPFSYTAERSGRLLDGRALSRAVSASLAGGLEEVSLSSRRVPARVTVAKLRERTALLSRFSTKFNAAAAGRAQNIALAGEKLNGAVVGAGERFSFNARVGERTRANGFCEAPVIFEGDFVSGVGGGVCQASTTLYNAALLAGMRVTEYHPHSLSVGYVEPSFDAMVSGKSADLAFVNGTSFPVYILCRVRGGEIIVSFYGEKSAFTYRRESVVTGRIDPPAPVYAEGGARVRAAKEGLTSEGYLVRLRGGTAVERKCIRRDRYAAVGAVLAPPATEEEPPLSGEEEDANARKSRFFAKKFPFWQTNCQENLTNDCKIRVEVLKCEGKNKPAARLRLSCGAAAAAAFCEVTYDRCQGSQDEAGDEGIRRLSLPPV